MWSTARWRLQSWQCLLNSLEVPHEVSIAKDGRSGMLDSTLLANKCSPCPSVFWRTPGLVPTGPAEPPSGLLARHQTARRSPLQRESQTDSEACEAPPESVPLWDKSPPQMTLLCHDFSALQRRVAQIEHCSSFGHLPRPQTGSGSLHVQLGSRMLGSSPRSGLVGRPVYKRAQSLFFEYSWGQEGAGVLQCLYNGGG